jgi:hypothetical protein
MNGGILYENLEEKPGGSCGADYGVQRNLCELALYQ